MKTWSKRSQRALSIQTTVLTKHRPFAHGQGFYNRAARFALLAGLGRLHGALWLNHRYRFTTWRWGRIAAAFVLVGWVMKAMLVV